MKWSKPLIVLLASLTSMAAAPFTLTDSGPGSPDFEKRFMASYGVNEVIEPQLTQKDRPLYESIAPYLRTNPNRAIELAQQGITSESNPAFHFLLGNLYYQVRNYAKAESHLRQAIDKLPSFRRAYRTLALIHVQQDQFPQSVAPLLKVIELGGGDEQSYGLLAYAYLTMEKYESSLSAYRMARMFKPDSPDFKRGQATCLLMTHQHKGAIALFDELLQDTPEEKDFWLLQANAFLALDERENAIANLEIVVDGGMSDWKTLNLLADLYLSEGADELAITNYKRALNEHTPSDWSVPTKTLKHLTDRRLFTVARDYLALLRDKAGDKLSNQHQLAIRRSEARIEMEVGDTKKAKLLLEEAVKADPVDGLSLLMLGEFHRRTGEVLKAEKYLEQAASTKEHEADAYVEWARLEIDKLELKNALKHLRKAQSLEPSPTLDRYIASIEKAIDASQ